VLAESIQRFFWRIAPRTQLNTVMTKVHANSWEVTDALWSRVEPLVPQPARDPDIQLH